MLPHTEMILRILAGAIFGGIIGFERDIHGHHVGLRTHFIVAMAASMFMILSTQFVYYQPYGVHDLVEVDASRIASTVVSGIGFLAGGAILRSGLAIKGVTTAAGLWLVTAIGMTSGAGMYIEAASVTALGLLGLTFLSRLEDRNGKRILKRISILVDDAKAVIPSVTQKILAVGGKVNEMDYEKDITAGRVKVTFELNIDAKVDIPALAENIQDQAGIWSISVVTPRH